MRPWRSEAQVAAGFVLAVVVLAVAGILVYGTMLGFIESTRAADRSRQALATLEMIYSIMNQAESAQRGYIIMGEEIDLRARETAVARLPTLIDELRGLLADDPEQSRRFADLERGVRERLDLLEWVLEARRTQGFEAARARLLSGPGREQMQAVRELVSQMEAQEGARLAERQQAVRANANRTLLTMALLVALAALSLSLLYARIRRTERERARAEQELRASETRLATIVDTAVEGIIVIDERGIIERFNPAAERIFGWAAAEAVGRNVAELMPEPHRSAHDGYIRRYLDTGETRIIGTGREVTGRRKDGSVFPAEIAVSEMHLGARRMFAGIVRDISERKRAEEGRARLLHELAAANEELTNFAYVVSHDLKAPLRGIGSLADWLMADYSDRLDDQGKEYLRLLKSRTSRMHALIDGILEYSRVGRIKETLAAVDLGALVEDAIQLLAPPPGVAIHVEARLPTVIAERTRLQQLFQNLIGNAIKHLDRPAGEIRIGCRADAEQWVFSVADNGPGIDPRHHDKIFQLFQTLTPRDRKEGTGVGLALVKKIVELYGGRVWVESQPGEGSTFYFTLPQTAASVDTHGGHASD